MPMLIRPLESRDEVRWRTLWDGYVEFYQASVTADVTDFTWARLLDADCPVFGLVAEQGGEVVGIVNGVLHENLWAARPVCYLEDLFVDPQARGNGAGKALIDAVVARAQAENWHRVYWRTAADNAQAQALYDKLAKRTGWVTYEVND